MGIAAEDMHEQSSAAFPPREFWLHDPETQGKQEVIYDAFGQVDIEATAQLLMSTVDPAFSFVEYSDFEDDHHAQYDHADYPPDHEGIVSPREYCNLPSRRTIAPRVFHNWWHKSLVTPNITNKEYMYEAVRAQRPIKLMRNAMKYAWTLAERSDKAHRYKQYRREIDARMGYFVRLLGELQQVPVEFQRLSVDDVELNNAYDMMSFSKRLKQVSLPTRPLVFSEGEVVQLRHTEINRAA